MMTGRMEARSAGMPLLPDPNGDARIYMLRMNEVVKGIEGILTDLERRVRELERFAGK